MLQRDGVLRISAPNADVIRCCPMSAVRTSNSFDLPISMTETRCAECRRAPGSVRSFVVSCDGQNLGGH